MKRMGSRVRRREERRENKNDEKRGRKMKGWGHGKAIYELTQIPLKPRI